ncbi:hypothetical protein I5U67_07495 [Stenotrophomonas maltophilia]|jgi:Ankyrin repeat|uniref:Ankyrin repeat domain-containing protein n=1 Tax=Stenotrophomonas maltophilia TaxID=40324 RepID=A0AA90AVC3_STEMA|nr:MULTISPECIES: hypothetical protein [Stenotrophomonas]HEJ3581786.1 hypothetical protein [Pseudomonas aeruginosa]EKT4092658.1 hypothetical protein [Stenotrophomonas maltophilia]MBA2130410.1 hypothetical protein [Stenotrophomonas maltophilia]MBH1484877.1 hypothetical protein [Stenotrophomonas maltophilia]MBH1631259.1 hypothetical protein [Stenotrophomonas maltophilia]
MNIAQRLKEFVRLTQEGPVLSGLAQLIGRSADTANSDQEAMGIADLGPVPNREGTRDLQHGVPLHDQVEAVPVVRLHADTFNSGQDAMGIADPDPAPNRESTRDLQGAVPPRERMEAAPVALLHAGAVDSDQEAMGIADPDQVPNRESIVDLQAAVPLHERVVAEPVTLFHAATSEAVAAALARGESVSDTDEQGRTALHHARNGEVVRALVEAGADLEARDLEGNIPAHTAHDDAMEELIAGVGRSIIQEGVKNNRGECAWDTRDYFEGRRREQAYYEQLEEEEAAKRAESDRSEQAFVFKVVALIEAGDSKALLELVEDPDTALVSRSRSYNIDGDEGWAYNEYAGYSVLHEAASVGNAQLCRELVFAGADWNKKCYLVGESGFDDYVNGFRDEGLKPVDFAGNKETRTFLENAAHELRAHNLSKRLEEIYPSADSWKPPAGGFAAEAQRQATAALRANGQDTQVQEAPRMRARL